MGGWRLNDVVDGSVNAPPLRWQKSAKILRPRAIPSNVVKRKRIRTKYGWMSVALEVELMLNARVPVSIHGLCWSGYSIRNQLQMKSMHGKYRTVVPPEEPTTERASTVTPTCCSWEG